MLGSSLPPGQLLVGGLVSYLRYLCLFAYNGVQYLLCCVLLLLLLSTSCFLCMVVYNIYCVFILVYLRLVSCVPNAASFSGLSILDYHFGSNVYR